MRGALISAVLLIAATAALAAEDSEPLDAAFLEYLGTLEGDGDNWTLLAEPEKDPAATDKAATDKKDTQTKAPGKDDSKRPRSSKEPVKPTAEEQ